MRTWLKEQWKFFVGALAALFAGLLVLLRLRAVSEEHKENLQDAKDAHDAELEVIRSSQNKLDAGLDEIAKKAADEKKDIERDHVLKRDDLEEEKREFIEKAKESDDLAKKIADAIGADFVESTKE